MTVNSGHKKITPVTNGLNKLFVGSLVMLTSIQLQELKVDTAAVLAFPSQLAHEEKVLPVSDENGNLRLILPSLPKNAENELLEKLEWILQRKITYDVADQDELVQLIRKHLSHANATMKNCDVRFSFQCPKNWIDLNPTSNPHVRFCETCRQEVRFCQSVDEMN